VLKAIEAINIIDLTPPGSIQGVGTGMVAVLGEFLKGTSLVGTPIEVTSAQEMLDNLGGWSPYSNPGGVRPAPGYPPASPKTGYDGNGFLAVRNKKFGRLVLVNVKQDVGTADISITTNPLGAGWYPKFSGKIPAGLRVESVPFADGFALLDDVSFNDTTDWVGAGPYTCTKTGIKIRRCVGAGAGPWNDAASAVNAYEATACFPGYTLDCEGISAVVAIDEAAMASYYTTALNALLNDVSPAKDVSVVLSARHPGTTAGETIIKALKQHAIDASAKGKGRVACASPILGLAKATAEGAGAGTEGVGNVGLSDRLIYCYPGIRTYIPEMPAAYITSTFDGFIDTASDSSLASVLSQLAPEQNPGQANDFLGHVLGIESGVTGLTVTDYEVFRSKGICAPKMDSAVGAWFQSGVTSVDPATYPSLVNIARRRMADYIQDSIAGRLGAFQKQLNTPARRSAIGAEIRAFLEGLKSPENPAASRIQDYLVDEQSGNTTAKLAQGIFTIITKVRTYSSLDFIVLQTLIGESVEISEVAA
jgi:hypothetical protein